MSTPKRDLRITITVNGQPMLTTGIGGAHIADALATYATLDNRLVAQGKSRDDVISWLKQALESLGDKPPPDVVAEITSTLLWAACRGEDGPKVEHEIRHGGATLMCLLKGADSAVSLLCMVSEDPTQH
jgi:hypothetical protein